ncbi:MAG TPA: radical SAM protein [Pseudonocardiaceae bacterium]|nr:radical SAM protein [Pseudonocardiaceae bacterium]
MACEGWRAMRADGRITHLVLELTGRCQMRCRHCFADSSPRGGHGRMADADWRRVLTSAAESGVGRVQFIGGEPTLHPACADLLEFALELGFGVEVFTNLVRVSARWWELFQRSGVSVATSYYSASATTHDMFTGLAGSHARTRANIAEAVRRGVGIRVSVVDIGDAESARADLRTLGVHHIKTGRIRQIGRAAPAGRKPSMADLCGRCAQGQAAIDPDGNVLPCVMARWIRIGNVCRTSLAEILASPRMAAVENEFHAAFDMAGGDGEGCSPDPQASCPPIGRP